MLQYLRAGALSALGVTLLASVTLTWSPTSNAGELASRTTAAVQTTAAAQATHPPNTRLDHRQPRPTVTTTSRRQSVSFVTDPEGLRTQCRFNGSAWELCTSPFTTLASTIGTNTFEARAVSHGVADPTPLQVAWTVMPPWTDAQGVQTAHWYACALSPQQQVLCWSFGRESYGWTTTQDSALAPSVMDPGIMAGRKFVDLSTGRHGACAITQAGKVICWDMRASDTSPRDPYWLDLSVALPGGGDVIDVSVSDTHSCLLDDQGNASCWGNNDRGELGDGTFQDHLHVPQLVDVSALPPGDFTDVTAGVDHSCALSDDAVGYCWGSGSDGQLGNGMGRDQPTPQPLTDEGALGGRPLAQIEAGGYHTCALDKSGRTYCWGLNALGLPGTSSIPIATFAQGDLRGVTIQQLSAGTGTTCALSDEGRPYCWGTGNSSSPLTQVEPTLVGWPKPGDPPANDLSASGGAACATTATGDIRCWGDRVWQWHDARVPLPVPAPGSHATPDVKVDEDVATVTTWLKLEASNPGSASFECRVDSAPWTSCALPYYPGHLTPGQHQVQLRAHIGDLVDPFPAVHVWAQLKRWTDAEWITENRTICSGNAAGKVACWPVPDSKGDHRPYVLTSPTLHGLTFDTLDSSGEYSCGLSDGSAFCWGTNSKHGRLGVGDLASRATPTPVDDSGVLAGRTLVELDSAEGFTCVIDDTGSVFCWGNGSQGSLGVGTTDDAKSPVAIPDAAFGNKDVVSLTAGGYGWGGHICAVTDTGKAYCWGAGAGGVLGNGDTADRLTPTPVATDGVLQGVNLQSLDTDSSHTCAVSSQGKAYCWGEGQFGQLGDGASTSSLDPVAVTANGALAGRTLADIDLTYVSSCALDTEGAAYCWGDRYRLGAIVMNDGNPTTWPSPEPLAVWSNGLLADVNLVELAGPCALSDTKDAYCWGKVRQDGSRTGSFFATPVAAPSPPG